jgi:uncharacterized membrane protein
LRIKIKNELLPLVLLVIIIIAVITLFPTNILRIILGLPFVLFLPGYTLMAALFPKKRGTGGIELLALSFGTSIIVVSLLGLMLSFTPWQIRLESVLYATAAFIFIMSAIAWVRRRRSGERFDLEFRLRLPGWGESARDKAYSVALTIFILGTLVVLGYVLATARVGEKYSEFYILGEEGQVMEYSGDLNVGEEVKVTVVIANHEYETVDYRIELTIDGIKNSEIDDITLEHNEKWQHEVSFTPEVAGENQEADFFLYKQGEDEPYFEPLRLWIDVTEPSP